MTILLLLLGAITIEQAGVVSSNIVAECEVVDLHYEQLMCNHRHNIDIERTSTVVLPSVRTTTSGHLRQAHERIVCFVVAEHLATTTNYPVSQFIHRLGNCARAVDFYLYILCQLRL